MKALVLTAYNHLEIQDWPRPEIAADEVLLRVAACGICGSDIHGMDGSTGRRQPPIIMGHEAAGTIVEVGAEVRDWAAGDRVTFDSTIYCGRCWHCRRGEINLCDNRRVLGGLLRRLPPPWGLCRIRRRSAARAVPRARRSELRPRRAGRTAFDRLARRRTHPRNRRRYGGRRRHGHDRPAGGAGPAGGRLRPDLRRRC